MSWFKVDDGFYDCDRVEDLEDEVCVDDPELACVAGWLWTKAGSYGRKQDNGGIVTRPRLFKLLPVTRDRALQAADALVECGLWERDGKGYRFKKWEKYGPNRSEDPEHVREGNRKRQQLKRERERAEKEAESHARENVTVTQGTGPAPPVRPVRPDQPVRPPQSPPSDDGANAEGPGPWTSSALGDAMRIAFRQSWLKHRKCDPSMAGRNLGDFPSRVLATAEARNADPIEIFRQALGRFVEGPVDEVTQRAPYAVFASRFAECLDGPQVAEDPAEARRRRRKREIESADRDMDAQLRGELARFGS